ncbi:MAG: ABC transporter permease, partial [Candidatus Latescibacterota bacterium]
ALGPTMEADFPEVEQVVRLRGPRGVWMMVYGDKVFFETTVFWAEDTTFDLFAFRFLEGDPATALVEPYSVAISRSAARKYFGAQDPMGQVIRADDEFALKVTGVFADMPPQSHFHADFLVPLTGVEVFYGRTGALSTWRYAGMQTYVRLRSGASPEAVAARFPEMVQRHVDPVVLQGGIGLHPALQPLTDIHKALGSSVQGIVLLLTRELTLLVVAAHLLAWPAAWWAMGRWLDGFAYRVELGLGVFVAGGAAALAVAWLTVGWQAVRDALRNPVEALRYE